MGRATTHQATTARPIRIAAAITTRIEDKIGVVWAQQSLSQTSPTQLTCSVSGRDAFLKSKAAQSLSLLFYELMTNSTKHETLSTSDGRVTVGWTINDSDSGRLFCFRWNEHNHEIAAQPTRQGFGTTLLTRLVPADLSGRATLDYSSGSFQYELEAPVEAVIEQESNDEENVKGIPTMRVVHGHSDPTELLA
jgi:hypothetical protein